MAKKLVINESLKDLVALLRENYWHMSVTGVEAMRDLWSELASNGPGFEETAKEIGVKLEDFHQAANLLGEWLRTNGMMDRSPMEASMDIRAEKLRFPEGPK